MGEQKPFVPWEVWYIEGKFIKVYLLCEVYYVQDPKGPKRFDFRDFENKMVPGGVVRGNVFVFNSKSHMFGIL